MSSDTHKPTSATVVIRSGEDTYKSELIGVEATERIEGTFSPATTLELSGAVISSTVRLGGEQEEEKPVTTYIEKLWDEAEVGAPQLGDIILRKLGDHLIHVRAANSGDVEAGADPTTRIVERAPKPKPKPRAVMASYVDDPDRREVYAERPGGTWESDIYMAEPDELVDPVPLVELPEHEELRKKFNGIWAVCGGEWPGSDTLANAVLELLEGKHKA